MTSTLLMANEAVNEPLLTVAVSYRTLGMDEHFFGIWAYLL